MPAARPASAPEPLRVRVTVADVPRAGAIVRVRPRGDVRPTQATKTDVEGIARFDAVAVEVIDVEAFAEGYRVQTWNSDWRNGDAWRGDDGVVNLRLEPGIPFDGRVLDAAARTPIAGASVVVRDWSDDLECGPTDAQGRFHVPP